MAVTSAAFVIVGEFLDETEDTSKPIRKRASFEHDRVKANENLMKDYFVGITTYPRS